MEEKTHGLKHDSRYRIQNCYQKRLMGIHVNESEWTAYTQSQENAMKCKSQGCKGACVGRIRT